MFDEHFNIETLTKKIDNYNVIVRSHLQENYSSFEYYLSLYAILQNIYPAYLAPYILKIIQNIW